MLSKYNCLTIWNTDNRMVENEKERNLIHHFQVGDISNPRLNIKKAFREKVESNLAL